MTEKPTISVVIACYNDGEYIGMAVDSVRRQSYPNIELVVVDDGSDQYTKGKLKGLEHQIDILLVQENLGVSAARNRGIEVANGEYVFVLDGDDYIESTLIEKAVHQMEALPNTKIVSCWARRFQDDKTVEVLKPKGGTEKDFLITNCALGTSMYRKSDLLEIGGYDVSMMDGFEDWELNLHLLSKGGTAIVLNEALYNYRITKNSRNEKAKRTPYDIIEYIYLKHSSTFLRHYDVGINRLIFKIKQEQQAKLRVIRSKEYRLGTFLLFPFRLFGIKRS